MATGPSKGRGKCCICDKDKDKVVYLREGCSYKFCFDHLTEHRQQLAQELDGIENSRNELNQSLIEQKNNRKKLPLMQFVDKWETDSINSIRQTARECRQLLDKHKNQHIVDMENKLIKLTEEMKQIRKDGEVSEIDLDQLKAILETLRDEVDQPRNIKIQEESTPYISKISVIVSSGKCSNSVFSDREATYT